MQNRRKILIDALHGRLCQYAEIEQIISDYGDIYLDSGHVDTELLTALLSFISEMSQVELRVSKALNRLLGISEDACGNEKKTGNGGRNMSAEDVLKQCTLVDNVLKLPNIQLSSNTYNKVKQCILEAGGSWVGGKTQGFSFPFNADRVFSSLKEGKRCDLKGDFQFFETPENLCDQVVGLLPKTIPSNAKVLEPSAGRGALIKAFHKVFDNNVDCFELMPENVEFLKKLDGCDLIGSDFMSCSNRTYDIIVANPPFCGNQDIKHLRKMYELLNEGGCVVCITSSHWDFAQEKECVDFRDWIKLVGAEVLDIDAGAFKKSGTTIRTKIIKIVKKFNGALF